MNKKFFEQINFFSNFEQKIYASFLTIECCFSFAKKD